MNSTQIRLDKYLAERGIASRRASAELITKGKVTVNGNVVYEPGIRIDSSKDQVSANNKPVSAERESLRTIALNKPRGYVCSTSSQGSKTVYELIQNIEERLVPVGRLDKNSEGLLLLSNDGDLINQLTHPRYEQEKVYHVTVSGTIDHETLKTLRSRLIIEGYKINPAKVTHTRTSTKENREILEFTLKEGRKRQIRAMCEQASLKVHRLIRIRTKNIVLKGIAPGKWRDLTTTELDLLRK